MKLQYLWVEKFKNLNDFEVDFSKAAGGLCTVILGGNGLGKSNLLEVLVVIFRDLYLGKASAFAYRLTYTLAHGAVRVSLQNLPRTKGKKGNTFIFEVSGEGRHNEKRHSTISSRRRSFLNPRVGSSCLATYLPTIRDRATDLKNISVLITGNFTTRCLPARRARSGRCFMRGQFTATLCYSRSTLKQTWPSKSF